MWKERVSLSSAERAAGMATSSNVAVPRRCRVEMEGGMWGGGHTQSDVAPPSHRHDSVVYKNNHYYI